jgi:hypothetical protein
MRFIFYLTNKKLELPLAAMFSYQGIFVDDLSYIILIKLGFREDKNVKMVDNGQNGCQVS